MRHYALANCQSRDAFSKRGNNTGRLMPRDMWQRGDVRQAVLNMNIRPTNSAGARFNKYFVWADLGARYIGDIERLANCG
jgi:hypothetical protein